MGSLRPSRWPDRPNGRRRRRGMTIFEVAVSTVVLGAAVTTAAQLVVWSVGLHQAALKKRCALEAATSVLDRVSLRPWSEITPESVKRETLPSEASEFLSDARLSVDVAEQADRLPAKQISVEIEWAHSAGHDQKVHLTTWVFQPGSKP
jgi:Tfp pilus assembly protein PilV